MRRRILSKQGYIWSAELFLYKLNICMELYGHMGIYFKWISKCQRAEYRWNCGQRTCTRVRLSPQSCQSWCSSFIVDSLWWFKDRPHQITRYCAHQTWYTGYTCYTGGHVWQCVASGCTAGDHASGDFIRCFIWWSFWWSLWWSFWCRNYISWLAAAPVLGSIISTNSSKSM